MNRVYCCGYFIVLLFLALWVQPVCADAPVTQVTAEIARPAVEMKSFLLRQQAAPASSFAHGAPPMWISDAVRDLLGTGMRILPNASALHVVRPNSQLLIYLGSFYCNGILTKESWESTFEHAYRLQMNFADPAFGDSSFDAALPKLVGYLQSLITTSPASAACLGQTISSYNFYAGEVISSQTAIRPKSTRTRTSEPMFTSDPRIPAKQFMIRAVDE